MINNFKNKINKYLGILLISIFCVFFTYGQGPSKGAFSGSFTGSVNVNAGQITGVSAYFQISTQTTSYGLTTNDNTIILNGSSLTATLPTAVGITGKVFNIINANSGSATVATTSSQNINASTTYTLSSQYNAVTVVSDGANWWIISTH